MGSFALRPSDLLTILKMASSIGYRSSVSFPPAIQATGLLTITPMGLSPTEHASLRWTRGFPLFHASSGRWKCGNRALRFPRAVGNEGNLPFGFPRCPSDRHFHGPLFFMHSCAGES